MRKRNGISDEMCIRDRFYNEQRVSPVYTKKYIAKSIKIQDVTVSHTEDWGNNYVKAGMIDQNTSTRWASKNVDASKPLEITLNFSEKETLDQMNFDLFVSKNNGIGAFEIQALSDGTYRTVYEGTKMGNIEMCIRDSAYSIAL